MLGMALAFCIIKLRDCQFIEIEFVFKSSFVDWKMPVFWFESIRNVLIDTFMLFDTMDVFLLILELNLNCFLYQDKLLFYFHNPGVSKQLIN